MFDNYLQHDAHEFIIFLLNYIGDVLIEEAKLKLEKQKLLTNGDHKLLMNGKKERSGIFSKTKRANNKPKKTNSAPPSSSRSFFLNSLKLRTSDSSSKSARSQTPSENDLNEDQLTNLSNGLANGVSISSQSDQSSSNISINDQIDQNSPLSSKLTSHSAGDCNSDESMSSSQTDEQLRLEQKEMLTWVHDIFQGKLTNETRCLTCETASEDYF